MVAAIGPTPDSQPLPLAMRAARKRMGLTQGEVAGRLGVSQSTISFWESGAETPTVLHLIALAAELPEILESLPGRERELLRRLLRIERQLFAGRCACRDCSCGSSNVSKSAAGG